MSTSAALAIPQISQLDTQARLVRVMEKTASLLPAEIGNQLRAMLTPSALATMACALVVWAGSHFFGVGEIADVVLLIVGWAAVGGVAWEAGKNAIDGVKKTMNAKVEEDIDCAAEHFAKVITLVGVQLTLTILMRRKPSVLKDDVMKGCGLGTAPRSPAGKWFYKPTTSFGRMSPGVNGEASFWGDITINARISGSQQRLTLLHEQVHQILTPKLYLLREMRCKLLMASYGKSYLLRYLEEALAETFAQLKGNGFSIENTLTGICFPVKNEYVSIAKLGQEARGVLLGPITVGGMIFNVYVTQSPHE